MDEPSLWAGKTLRQWLSVARPWLEQAAEDLATARRLVNDGESPP